jgi:hypothetical protein
MGGEAHRHQ